MAIRSLVWRGPQHDAAIRANERWDCCSSWRIRNFSNRRVAVATALGPTEIGARDPFPAEVESNFGNKVLGNENTEHVILIPSASALSLAQRSCSPTLPTEAPFTLKDARSFLRKVVGWRLIEEPCLKLQCEWRLKDHDAGLELMNRVSCIAEAEGQPLQLYLDDQTHVLRAEIWTEQIGGLCENNFILAAKIDQVKTSDLVKRNRFWA